RDADGRAVREHRRADAAQAPARPHGVVRAAPPDRLLRHPRHRGGRLPVRPGRRAVGPAEHGARHRRGPIAAAAKLARGGGEYGLPYDRDPYREPVVRGGSPCGRRQLTCCGLGPSDRSWSLSWWWPSTRSGSPSRPAARWLTTSAAIRVRTAASRSTSTSVSHRNAFTSSSSRTT